MKKSLAQKLLILVGFLIGVPSYLYGLGKAISWSARHMWVQTEPQVTYPISRDHVRSGVERVREVVTFHALNLYWGSVLIVATVVAVTAIVVVLVVKEHK